MKKGIGLPHALRGIWKAIRFERNMRIHVTAVFYVTAYAVIGQIEAWAWCAILLCFGLALGAEAINAALEHLGDEVSEEHRPRIGVSKDMAAGAVLICAVISVAVAVVVFGRREVWERILEAPASRWILLGLPVFAVFVLGFDLRGKK